MKNFRKFDKVKNTKIKENLEKERSTTSISTLKTRFWQVNPRKMFAKGELAKIHRKGMRPVKITVDDGWFEQVFVRRLKVPQNRPKSKKFSSTTCIRPSEGLLNKIWAKIRPKIVKNRKLNLSERELKQQRVSTSAIIKIKRGNSPRFRRGYVRKVEYSTLARLTFVLEDLFIVAYIIRIIQHWS